MKTFLQVIQNHLLTKSCYSIESTLWQEQQNILFKIFITQHLSKGQHCRMIYCQCLGVCKCFSNVESLSWAFCTELCRTLQFCSDSAGFWVELHFLQNIFIGGTICLPGWMFWTCSTNVCARANFDTM